MKQPLWKRFLSHFMEFHIESAPSDINPHLYVSLSRGQYQLSTTNAIYSYGDLYDNFVKGFKVLNFDKLTGKKVLILGFGLGSIPLILEKKFNKQFDYVAVELDESVLYLANKYTVPELQSNIQFICTNALTYVEQCQEQFDLICMDVFLDDTVPKAFEKVDFLANLQSLLKPNGLLLFNRLALTNADIVNTKLYYKTIFSPFFPKGTYRDVDGNWILFSREDMILD